MLGRLSQLVKGMLKSGLSEWRDQWLDALPVFRELFGNKLTNSSGFFMRMFTKKNFFLRATVLYWEKRHLFSWKDSDDSFPTFGYVGCVISAFKHCYTSWLYCLQLSSHISIPLWCQLHTPQWISQSWVKPCRYKNKVRLELLNYRHQQLIAHMRILIIPHTRNVERNIDIEPPSLALTDIFSRSWFARRVELSVIISVNWYE